VAAALAFLGVVYAVYQALTGAPLTEATFYWGALRIVPCFAYGCSLYLLWRSGAADGRIKPLVGTGLSLLALVLSAALGAPDAAVVASGGSLILFLAGMSSSGSRLVSSPVLVWLGEVSYASIWSVFPGSWRLAAAEPACSAFPRNRCRSCLGWSWSWACCPWARRRTIWSSAQPAIC
jgi:peptidoglycan/LPS O-acetylase OafA/YrhL